MGILVLSVKEAKAMQTKLLVAVTVRSSFNKICIDSGKHRSDSTGGFW